MALNVLGDINGDGYLDFTRVRSNATTTYTQSDWYISTGPGVWRVADASAFSANTPLNGAVSALDVNNDGYLDFIVNSGQSAAGTKKSDSLTIMLSDGKGGFNQAATWTLNADKFASSIYWSSLLGAQAGFGDLNNDGYIDYFGAGNLVAWGRSDGSYTVTTLTVNGATATAADQAHVMMADVNGDGRQDLVYVSADNKIVIGAQDAGGSFTDIAPQLGWDAAGSLTAAALLNSKYPWAEGLFGAGTSLQLVDVNGDRSLDMVIMGVQDEDGLVANASNVLLNNTPVAENTFLRVMVANDHGGLDAYGATVRLYDSSTGALVASRQASNTSMALSGTTGSYGADFYGLDPTKSYDIVVVYPGSDKQVTVLTGKAGLGVGNVAAGALNQIVDSSLSAVTPGGKDVVWVAKENRATSTTGGYWQGTNLADQMVGDKGDDVFKPNGARAGEAGDTLTGGGGHDRYIFDVKAVLNTPATITDFSASPGAESDSLDMGALLTAVGYTGPRTAAGVAGWVNLVSSGGNTTLQVDAHTGSGGAASGYVDLVKLNGVTGKTLADLVSGGFVHLGGVKLSGIVADQTVSESAAMAGVSLATGATVSAEGGQWATGFTGGKLLVKLDAATADDTLGFANVNSVSYDSVSGAVKIGATQIATVDSTFNGVGTVGKLSIGFDFSAAGSSYATEAQQAAAVQAVLQSLKLTSNTYAPSAMDRGLTFTLTDALGDSVDVMSGLHITPQANNGTLGGVNYITGTESVETLVGTTANETFVGYNGVPTAANTAGIGSVFTFGDTLTGGGGKDTFKWLSQQLMNSDAANKVTDFGLKGATGVGQGAAEADVIDIASLLKGYTNTSVASDFIKAAAVNGKVQLQVDYDGKANGSTFDNSWFLTLDNLTVNANNEVLANNATIAATAPGLSGNVTINNLVQQMLADQQFKVL
jgi:hypothetical protein